jgi:hypothetical protein
VHPVAQPIYVLVMTDSQNADDRAVLAWIDHIVLAVPDLGVAHERVIDTWGVTPTIGGSHVDRGTRNVLLSLGDTTYLEIIGPDTDQPDPTTPRSFGIDDLDSASTGRLAGWAFGTNDIEGLAAYWRSLDVDPGPIRSMARVRPDGVRLDWRLTQSEAREVSMPFIIDWGDTPTPATDSAHGCSIVSVSAVLETEGRAAALRSTGVNVELGVGADRKLNVVLDTPRGTVVLG